MSSHSIRTLESEGEVERWLNFVAQCFAFKGVPRQHFATHFWGDPWRDARLIIVAEGNLPPEPDILSTLRVFRRQIYCVDGSTQSVGGIGEVCTRPDWQRRGLCRELLGAAVDLMQSNSMVCACLHTSSMAEVYRRCGFVSVSEFRVSIRLHLRACPAGGGGGGGGGGVGPWHRSGSGNPWVRAQRVHAKLDAALSPSQLQQLSEQHASFHKGRFCGALARDNLGYHGPAHARTRARAHTHTHTHTHTQILVDLHWLTHGRRRAFWWLFAPGRGYGPRSCR